MDDGALADRASAQRVSSVRDQSLTCIEEVVVRKGRPMATMEEALDELRGDPQSFLRHYVVTIAISGGTSGNGQQHPATFLIGPSGNPASPGFQTGLSGLAGRSKDRGQLRITTVTPGFAAAPGQSTFEAWYIPMSEMNDAPTRRVLLPSSGGPDIALTSQMSGCTFAIGSPGYDGSRYVSHIRPPKGEPDAKTYDDMRQKASFGDMETFFDRESRVGSRTYANRDNFATVIGVRRNGNWRFYAQTYNRGDRRLFKVEALNG
jgi:hypothetical protein